MATDPQAEPNVESVLDNFAKGGWDGLADEANFEANKTYSKSQAEARREIALARVSVFRTPEGRKALEWMLDMSLRRAAWDNTKPAAEALNYGMFREGQNSIVAAILKEMLIADGEQLNVIAPREKT